MQTLRTVILLAAMATTAGAQIDPSITVGAAVGGIINTSGQAPRTVTVAWNAGSHWTHCEVYYTVNNANQAELARGHDGTTPLTVTAGNAYHLWMVVYPGGGDFRVVTELRVTAAEGPALPPPPPSTAGTDRGGFAEAAVNDRGPVERVFRVPINNVRVEAGAHHVMIRFDGQPDQKPYVAIGRAPAIKQNNEWVFSNNLVGGGFVGIGTVTDAEKAKGQYMFASSFGSTISEEGLEPGETYYYIISIPGPDPRPFQATGTFSMLREMTTVRVVWERVLVLDDSDDLSAGEIRFRFWHNHGQPGGKTFDVLLEDANSGRGYDVSKSVVIENAPNTLLLSATGFEDDSGVQSRFISDDNEPFNANYSDATSDQNAAQGEFDLTQSPGVNVRVPFVLNARPEGSLNYTVFGRLEITRTAGPGLGTTSPLKTYPVSEGIRPQPRVRQADGTIGKSTLTVCQSAKKARERNSPAAPGLEAKCAAEGAVRPTGRVTQPDGTTTKSTLPICEAAKQARARNSPAAPGLEAKCLAEQKR